MHSLWFLHSRAKWNKFHVIDHFIYLDFIFGTHLQNAHHFQSFIVNVSISILCGSLFLYTFRVQSEHSMSCHWVGFSFWSISCLSFFFLRGCCCHQSVRLNIKRMHKWIEIEMIVICMYSKCTSIFIHIQIRCFMHMHNIVTDNKLIECVIYFSIDVNDNKDYNNNNDINAAAQKTGQPKWIRAPKINGLERWFLCIRCRCWDAGVNECKHWTLNAFNSLIQFQVDRMRSFTLARNSLQTFQYASKLM